MSVTVTAVHRRSCCSEIHEDFVFLGKLLTVVNDQLVYPEKPYFYVCKHCGLVYEEEHYTDAAGSRDSRMVKTNVRIKNVSEFLVNGFW